MNSDEMGRYLANVLAVARSDGVLSPHEEEAIEDVRVEIRAKKTDLKNAQKLSQREDFRASPVGRYSDKIRNLEDMVFMSLVDGDLDSSEKEVIRTFAKQLNVSQDQINQIVSESKVRLRGQVKQTRCPGCGTSIAATAKFCPDCGEAVLKASAVNGTKVAFDYPTEGISIEFAESTSASFDNALKVAQAALEFQECERSRKKWFLATWPTNDILGAVALAEQLKGIRNRKVYINGNEMTWDEVFGFLWCMRQRKSAYRAITYCFGADDNQPNLWGCKQARMEWGAWANWLSYGQFKRKDRFILDKQRIQHELRNNVHSFRFCPFMRRALMEAVLETLPGEVKISEGHGWQYKESYERTPSCIKVVQTETEDGCTYKREFHADGVAPIGFQVGREILCQALKMCGITDVDANSVFS